MHKYHKDNSDRWKPTNIMGQRVVVHPKGFGSLEYRVKSRGFLHLDEWIQGSNLLHI